MKLRYNNQIQRFYKIMLIGFTLVIIGCEGTGKVPIPEPLTPREMFVSKYDGALKVFYEYPTLGFLEGSTVDYVVEMRHEENNKYSCYFDGYWEFSLEIVHEYDDIIYFNINYLFGAWTEDHSHIYFKAEGSTICADSDHPMYHGSFDSETGKLQFCRRRYDLDPPQAYDYIVEFWEGFRREE